MTAAISQSWIDSRMALIPEDRHDSVKREFENLRLSRRGGNEMAREFLKSTARAYRLENTNKPKASKKRHIDV